MRNIKEIRLEVLFSNNLDFDILKLVDRLSAYHYSLKDIKIEQEDRDRYLIRWQNHVVKIVSARESFPSKELEMSISPAYYSEEIKQQGYDHNSYMLLSYMGKENNPLEQYLSLTLIAGFFGSFGAVVILNQNAHTSFPARVFDATTFGSSDEIRDDILGFIRELPLTYLFCGFVKYVWRDSDEIMFRTHGASLLGLPNFATFTKDHSYIEKVFQIYNNIFNYLLESKREFIVGDTMQVDENIYLKLRLPTEQESYFEDDETLLIVEFITQNDILPDTIDSIERRERSNKILEKYNVPINKDLPTIIDDREVNMRTTEEIATRFIALLWVALKADSIEEEAVKGFIERYNIKNDLTAKERVFIQNSKPTESQTVESIWRYESAWVLLWALGYVDELSYPNDICNISVLIGFIKGKSREEFIESAKPRLVSEILDEADLIYRYHWAVVDARVNGLEIPKELDASVIYERHYALNWLIGYMGQEWDDVSTDT